MVCIYLPASSEQPFDSHLRHRDCVSVTSWRGFGGWGEKELDLIFLVVEAKNKRAHTWTLGSLFGQSSSCHMDAKYSCLWAESIRLGLAVLQHWGEGGEFGFSATWLFSAVSPPPGSWAFSGGPFSRRPAETLPSPPPFMYL